MYFSQMSHLYELFRGKCVENNLSRQNSRVWQSAVQRQNYYESRYWFFEITPIFIKPNDITSEFMTLRDPMVASGDVVGWGNSIPDRLLGNFQVTCSYCPHSVSVGSNLTVREMSTLGVKCGRWVELPSMSYWLYRMSNYGWKPNIPFSLRVFMTLRQDLP